MTKDYNSLRLTGSKAEQALACMQVGGAYSNLLADGHTATSIAVEPAGDITIREHTIPNGSSETDAVSTFHPAKKGLYASATTPGLSVEGDIAEKKRQIALKCVSNAIKP